MWPLSELARSLPSTLRAGHARRAGLVAGRGGAAGRALHGSENGEVLLREVGTLRCLFPPNASVQWQPDGLTIHTGFPGAGFLEAGFLEAGFLGAGFLGAPPISLILLASKVVMAWQRLGGLRPGGGSLGKRGDGRGRGGWGLCTPVRHGPLARRGVTCKQSTVDRVRWSFSELRTLHGELIFNSTLFNSTPLAY